MQPTSDHAPGGQVRSDDGLGHERLERLMRRLEDVASAEVEYEKAVRLYAEAFARVQRTRMPVDVMAADKHRAALDALVLGSVPEPAPDMREYEGLVDAFEVTAIQNGLGEANAPKLEAARTALLDAIKAQASELATTYQALEWASQQRDEAEAVLAALVGQGEPVAWLIETQSTIDKPGEWVPIGVAWGRQAAEARIAGTVGTRTVPLVRVPLRGEALSQFALDEAALALMQHCGDPEAPQRTNARIAVEAYLRALAVQPAPGSREEPR